MACDLADPQAPLPEPPDSIQGAVYCPGTINLKSFRALNEDDFRHDLEVNLLGAVRFLKVPLDRVVVFHDELDIAPGRVRMKKGGGAGGHNGLRDLDAHVGKDYRRVRIGIGHPGHKDLVLHWVLRDFEPDERDPKTGWVPKLLSALAEESALLIEGGAKADEKYMSRVAHLAPPPDLPARLDIRE
ncbi:MAG: aminoacyl-tRNA hydrolase [Mycobacteriaceae bacterium]|nr:aminoacyl-tRNA hydrolase [Mycobacteriaceae bacterium]